jgi:predicted metal-dependent enzyme (double-stranded beta helix superfamily)
MSLALVDPIRRAVRDDRVTTLARTMAELGSSGAFDDPDLYLGACADHYARRLVWRDPNGAFVVVAMTWAPGQAAALHDHGGVWGVEIVAEGTMCETAYRLVERDESGRCRFEREGERIATKGSSGVLCPPHEYHTFANVGSTPARTLHVYGGSFEHINTYAAQTERWWRAARVTPHYDA